MKKFIMLLLGIMFLTGCGKDGVDGKDGTDGEAYITYSWASNPFTYSTNDPEIPGYIYSGTYYKTIPGIYTFWYQSWDSSYWYGSYTIYINEGTNGTLGTKGGIFTDGIDGVDGVDGTNNYFYLSCLSFGWTLYTWNYPYYSGLSIDKNITEIESKEIIEIEKRGFEVLPVEERLKLKGFALDDMK